MSRRIIIAVALLWLGALALRADDSIEVQRPLSIMFMTDVGHASVLDSYLTPITYDGVDLRLSFDAMRACGNHNNWARQLNVAVQYDNVENNVGNNTMHNLAAQARWGMMRRWDDVTPAHLRFMVGPMAQLRGGRPRHDPTTTGPVHHQRRHRRRHTYHELCRQVRPYVLP